MTKIKTIDFDKFIACYEPFENHLVNDAPYSNYMFETYGVELEYVKLQDEDTVWTIVECDDEEEYIIQGFHYVNRIGYIITQESWDAKKEVQVDINEKISIGKAKLATIDFLEEIGIELTDEQEDKLHDFYSNLI